MPTEAQHLRVAARNQGAMTCLLASTDPYPEWVIVTAFYKALHLVEALFDHDQGVHLSSHRERRRVLKTENRYRKIFGLYDELRRHSEVARYTGLDVRYPPTAEGVEAVQRDIVNGLLNPLEKSVRKLLGQSGAGKGSRSR